MKKSILTTLIAILVSQHINAQLSIRPEAGLNLGKTKMQFDDPLFPDLKTKRKVGFKVGTTLQTSIAKNLFLEGGAFYLHSHYDFDVEASYSGSLMKNTGEYSIDFLQIPVCLEYDINMNNTGTIFIGAGGYFSYAFSGKQEMVTSEDAVVIGVKKGRMDFGSDNTDDYETMDEGILFNIGYQLPVGFYTRAQYSLGLVNLSPQKSSTYKSSAISVTIGYEFKL